MKYFVRFIIGAFIGYLVGAVLNIALSNGFWDVFWPDLRNWTVFDFFSNPGDLNGWARFGLMLPVLAGGFTALPGWGWGILGALGAALLVVIIAFVVGFFVVIGPGGILALLLFFGLIAAPVGGVIVFIFG